LATHRSAVSIAPSRGYTARVSRGNLQITCVQPRSCTSLRLTGSPAALSETRALHRRARTATRPLTVRVGVHVSDAISRTTSRSLSFSQR
jgi:hypothetical protein